MILSIKKFLQIIFFLVFLLCFLPSIVFAQINRNNETFGQDLESLGLDNIEGKPEIVKTNAKINVNKKKSKTENVIKKEPKKLTPNFSNDKNLKLFGKKNLAKTEKLSQKSQEITEKPESKEKLATPSKLSQQLNIQS